MLRLLLCLACLAAGWAASTPPSQLPLQDLVLPPGFSVHLYAAVPGARELALSRSTSSGLPVVVYVGTTGDPGSVYALVDLDGTGSQGRLATAFVAVKHHPCLVKQNVSAVTVHTVLSGRDQPNGVAWHNGSLYVAEDGKVAHVPERTWSAGLMTSMALRLVGRALAQALSSAWPSQVPQRDSTCCWAWAMSRAADPAVAAANQSDHQVHFMAVSPDERLYLNQGAPSNTGPCPAYGKINLCSIVSMKLDGSDLHTYAYGAAGAA